YDISRKRRYVKSVADAIERLLLDNLSVTPDRTQTGGGDKYADVYRKLYEGKSILELLANIYGRLKEFQAKLDVVLTNLKSAEDLSHDTATRLADVKRIRDNYDAILERLGAAMRG